MRTILFFFILLLCQKSIAQDKQQISFEQYDLLSSINHFYNEIPKLKEVQPVYCGDVLLCNMINDYIPNEATKFIIKLIDNSSLELSFILKDGTIGDVKYTKYGKDVIKVSHLIINDKYKFLVSVNGKSTFTY